MPSETKTETQLENLLFGADVDFTLPTLPFTFEIDNTGDVPGAASDSKPVWVDDEVLDVNLIDTRRKKLRLDENETLVSADVYQQRLRTQFQKLHPVPEWANAPSTNDLPFLGNQSSLIKQTSQINSDFLNISRLKDANQADRCKSIVSSLQFHPTAPVMFTSGLDKTLRLFNIDGRLNLKISSTYFADLPITKAKFTIDGQNIICVGRKKYFYNYDIESGSVSRISHIRGREEHSLDKHFISPCNKFIVFIGMNGSIILLCRKTMQLIDVFKMNKHGDVYQWDLETRTCIKRWNDQAAINPSSIAISINNSFIATGSSSGVVNLYNAKSCLGTESSSNPDPLKSFMNLSTPINQVLFHPSNLVMAYSSSTKKDSLKLCHVDSQSVFSNWPTANTPLGYVQCMDFSPNGGYFGVGNDKGVALLFKLKQFSDY